MSLCFTDCRRGQSLVVHAINEGRQCAREVDQFLNAGVSTLSGPGGVLFGRRDLLAFRFISVSMKFEKMLNPQDCAKGCFGYCKMYTYDDFEIITASALSRSAREQY